MEYVIFAGRRGLERQNEVMNNEVDDNAVKCIGCFIFSLILCLTSGLEV